MNTGNLVYEAVILVYETGILVSESRIWSS